MKNFIIKHRKAIEEAPTSTIYELWRNEHGWREYPTKGLFYKALQQYGYRTKVKHFRGKAARVYVLTEYQRPVWVKCPVCGDKHKHVEPLDLDQVD